MFIERALVGSGRGVSPAAYRGINLLWGGRFGQLFGWVQRIVGLSLAYAGTACRAPTDALLNSKSNDDLPPALRIEDWGLAQLVLLKFPAGWVLRDIVAYFVKFPFIADYALEVVALPNACVRSAEDFASTLRNGGFE
jgi:hypothetical protein